jgi:hypothetical protein
LDGRNPITAEDPLFRKTWYPRLRARYFTRLSVWPRFGSNVSGNLPAAFMAASLVTTWAVSGLVGAGALLAGGAADAVCGAGAGAADAWLDEEACALLEAGVADAVSCCDERLAAARPRPLAFMLVIPFKPASTPTSRTITVKIESDNLPVRCPMIFFIADRSKYAFLNSRSL